VPPGHYIIGGFSRWGERDAHVHSATRHVLKREATVGCAQNTSEPHRGDRSEAQELQFNVNQQSYFLNFLPEEGRWFVLKPTRDGVEILAVVHDDAPIDPEEVAVDLDSESVN
jgi:hypothetical protein